MVLFAALAMARFAEWMPPLDWASTASWLANVAGLRRSRWRVMVVVAWLIERLVLGKLVNQEGITLLMATLGIAYFLDGFGQTLFGSDIYKIDIGMPKDPIFVLDERVPGRRPDQQGRPVRRGDRGRAGRAAGAVLPEDRPPAARCARWPTTTRRRSRSAFR